MNKTKNYNHAVPTELKTVMKTHIYKHSVPTRLKKTEVCPSVTKTLHTLNHPEAFNYHLNLLWEGFLTPNSAAVYLKSGLETPPTNVNLDN